MNTTNPQEQITALFRESGPAHHKAYIETNGADPDWPIWYAAYLHERLSKLLKGSFTKSELVCLLIEADKEHKQKAKGTDWPSYYAQFFLERYN